MGVGHGHGHAGTAGAANSRRLAVVLGMMLAVAVVQVAGAALSGSLALLADAGHTVTDSLGVALALAAVWIAARPATNRRTFGYQRAEILAAAVNALVLFVLCGFIVVEAVERLQRPAEVSGLGMVVVAAFGLVMNVGALFVLRAGSRTSLNVKGAYLEVMGDALASVGVIAGGIVVWTTGWARVDTLVSLGIAVIIVPRAWALLREAVHILLEATPRGMDLSEVRDHLLGHPAVLDVHDLHAWTITSGVPVMSAHVVVADGYLGDSGRMLDELHACLTGHFDVEHSTLQLEPPGHADHEGSCHA
ncbi:MULTISPECIES: cation diffusion facilitator family transporter [Nocardiopsis]|uniref:Cation transporter n=1 Tax=Nocardiopsis sinuspersici TaxID=501010 RepID=A0A1V3BWE9_9ACTN|nr:MULTISPECIES: cation diffusion facilitator family transporter [Nocardiopsis]NYH53951.1 cobalt-zinc-cadmium efflux system protein [Nocardiopsis sinuspersici]OOC52851.1 cation transporter [Nocardiopsis sinuspersici]